MCTRWLGRTDGGDHSPGWCILQLCQSSFYSSELPSTKGLLCLWLWGGMHWWGISVAWCLSLSSSEPSDLREYFHLFSTPPFFGNYILILFWELPLSCSVKSWWASSKEPWSPAESWTPHWTLARLTPVLDSWAEGQRWKTTGHELFQGTVTGCSFILALGSLALSLPRLCEPEISWHPVFFQQS